MKYKEILSSVNRISIFSNVADDHLTVLVLGLAGCHCDPDEARAEIFRLLAEYAELRRSGLTGNAWQDYLLDMLLSSENAFTRKVEFTGLAGIGGSLMQQVESELADLRRIYDLDIDAMLEGYPSINGFVPVKAETGRDAAIKTRLHECPDWASCIGALAEYYAEHGSGEFGRYRAFRWSRESGAGCLIGVESPDPIRLSDLVEYEWQHESVRRNTEKLLAGLPSNNMLLYGDRGTGKSSSVKSMLNEFGGCGLRIIEVSKDNLIDLPQILSILRRRPEKFILFLDDLSFEENETRYKALKAVLEGGLEARPANVVLYATSNRRNLIREKFSDRTDDDEVHPGDTMQEKLSLSDRFGLRIQFLVPDQEEYLHIVSVLLERAGILMTDELRKSALTWQHARSGRSARQFVDYILGEKGLDRLH